MARRSHITKLLTAVLRVLATRPLAEEELLAALSSYKAAEIFIALEALEAEGLIEASTRAGVAHYAVTGEGIDAVGEPAARRSERLTILFTDVIGSTELFDRLGDDAAHALMRRHFALLREALRDHAGREIKSLGDGLMVSFASGSAAVACGRAMQQAVASSPDPLQLRIGIGTGEVVCEDGDCFGRPVIVARRLCDAAQAGDIFVMGTVADGLEPLGPLELKGLSEPIPASAARLRPFALTA